MTGLWSADPSADASVPDLARKVSEQSMSCAQEVTSVHVHSLHRVDGSSPWTTTRSGVWGGVCCLTEVGLGGGCEGQEERQREQKEGPEKPDRKQEKRRAREQRGSQAEGGRKRREGSVQEDRQRPVEDPVVSPGACLSGQLPEGPVPLKVRASCLSVWLQGVSSIRQMAAPSSSLSGHKVTRLQLSGQHQLLLEVDKACPGHGAL